MRISTSDAGLILPQSGLQTGHAESSTRPRPDTLLGIRNRLLQKLPQREMQSLMRRAERVELRPRQILHHWNMPMRDVYFVEQGLVSVSVKISRDCAVEGWLIGSEGMTGVPVLFGDRENPPFRRVVQVGGQALRIASHDLLAALGELETLNGLFLRYAQFVLCQSSQWGACNAHHSLKQRMGRWLLAASDALESDRLPVTHQLLARLLGVRRAGVSECLNAMEARGIIRNTRSLIQIADPEALRTVSCDCHRLVQRDYRRLFQTEE